MRSITIGACFQQPALIRSRLPAARWTQQVVPYSVTGNRSWTVVFPDFQTFQLSRRHVVNQCCDIFISQDRINPGWTLRLYSKQTRNSFELTNLDYQKINIMKLSVASIASLIALFSQGLAASAQPCASLYCPLLL